MTSADIDNKIGITLLLVFESSKDIFLFKIIIAIH